MFLCSQPTDYLQISSDCPSIYTSILPVSYLSLLQHIGDNRLVRKKGYFGPWLWRFLSMNDCVPYIQTVLRQNSMEGEPSPANTLPHCVPRRRYTDVLETHNPLKGQTNMSSYLLLNQTYCLGFSSPAPRNLKASERYTM